MPGDEVQSDDDLRQFVRDNAWGHHASCTCPIGPREHGGVLGADFRVHGTTGLRVVDASVFPRIPGFFIASAVYMIGEKAADVILAGSARVADGLTRQPWPFVRQINTERERPKMAYDVPELLKMSQSQLDDLFTKSAPGDIPDGEAQGTAIVAPGTTYTKDIAAFINHFAWQARSSIREKGVLKNRIPTLRAQRDHRESLQGTELARRQGVHRPRLLRNLARRAVDSR